MKICLRILRKTHPTWTWRAVREPFGFGWNYEGRRGDEHVTLEPRSELVGGSDDDARTSWWVRGQDGSLGRYEFWSFVPPRNGPPAPPTPPGRP